MRLIDADALLEKCNKDQTSLKFAVLTLILHYAPTIDAVEVVRCKDCMKLNRLKKYTGFGEVQFVCENTKMTVYETDFCSYGERREP